MNELINSVILAEWVDIFAPYFLNMLKGGLTNKSSFGNLYAQHIDIKNHSISI